VALVIVLPILTRRRVQCGLFCPFGAMQSFLNKINIFDVRIDREKCTDCGRCIRACPTFSLDEDSVKNGQTRITCTKCGQCVDSCPKGAISFHIKGTRAAVRPNLARMLFIYPAFLFGATMSMGTMMYALWRVLKLVTTGSLF
jgi:polyferredoxin